MADRPEIPDIEIHDDMPGGRSGGGLSVTRDRPYRILVVADFAGSEKGTVSAALAEGVVELRPETFDDVMKAAAPSITYTTTDPLQPGNVMTEVKLCFTSIRDFEPKNLARQIPTTAALLDARQKIVDRMHGRISAEQLKSTIASQAQREPAIAWMPESLAWKPAGGGTPVSAEAVDSVLGGIDLGDGGGDAPAPKSPIGSIVSAAASAGGVSIPADEASSCRHTLAELDRRLNVWINAVLHAPSVQECEAAWRGLAFLVAQSDYRKGMRISALHAHRGEISPRFISRLIDPVFDAGADAPDLIVLNFEFVNSPSDIELLDEMAQHGASIPAVVFAGAAPGFFGAKQAWQMATLPPIVSMFDQWQYAKWKSLRGQRYARSLGLFFGKCLLRSAYGETAPPGDLEFHFREDAVADRDFCWTTGALAAACAVARSVNDTGWPTAMAGYVHGRVEGFAIAQGGKNKDKKFGPTDTLMPLPKIEELAAAGVNAAVGIKDHNDAIIWNGLTAARPLRVDVDAFQEVSLPYQLFATRLSNLLFAIKPSLHGMDKDKVTTFVHTHVSDWLKSEGEPTEEQQVAVQVRPAEDAPTQIELAVTVTPPKKILPGAIPVVLGYRI